MKNVIVAIAFVLIASIGLDAQKTKAKEHCTTAKKECKMKAKDSAAKEKSDCTMKHTTKNNPKACCVTKGTSKV